MFRHAARIALVALGVAATLAIDARLLAQANAADPFVGNLTLDRTKSTFTGVAPDRRSMKFEKVPMGIRHTTESKQGDVIYKLVYTFQVDGKDYAADVAMSIRPVAFQGIDTNTLERTGKSQGMVQETVTYTLSDGGKTLTAVQKLTANPDEINSTQVFMKQ